MVAVIGPGPFRNVPDQELRIIFYLTSQTGYVLEVLPFKTMPPPGTSDKRVTQLLRRMLYLRQMDQRTVQRLAEDVRALQSDRQMIAISAKLLSLMRDAFERPWAFPALLTTSEILQARRSASGVVDATRLPANATASTAGTFLTSWLSKFAGTIVGHSSYLATVTNRNYEFRVQRMNTELNLRGVNAELLR